MMQNREKWNKSVKERIAKNKAALLDQFKKMPVLQVALERAKLSRSTYYHWRDEDERFRKDADAAIAEGEALITDMSESQLISMIRDKHFQAVQLWLRHHHPKYTNKVEVYGKVNIEDEPMTPEQAALAEEALRLAALPAIRSNIENHEEKQPQQNESAG